MTVCYRHKSSVTNELPIVKTVDFRFLFLNGIMEAVMAP